MGRVLMVLSDGLRNDVAAQQMRYLETLVAQRQATRFVVRGELPSLSRPCYEAIHAGVPASVHGVVGNEVVRLSNRRNLFSEARRAGLRTAAAAYYWFSELYNHAPYDPARDERTEDDGLLIQRGRFYVEDSFPDAEVWDWAEGMADRWAPDYLLLHPMGCDYIGELRGGESPEYARQVSLQDDLLAARMPGWLASGYTVLVTGDHGINREGVHGGASPEERMVPLYAIRPDGAARGNTGMTVSQLQIAPTVLALLGLGIPAEMAEPPVELG